MCVWVCECVWVCVCVCANVVSCRGADRWTRKSPSYLTWSDDVIDDVPLSEIHYSSIVLVIGGCICSGFFGDSLPFLRFSRRSFQVSRNYSSFRAVLFFLSGIYSPFFPFFFWDFVAFLDVTRDSWIEPKDSLVLFCIHQNYNLLLLFIVVFTYYFPPLEKKKKKILGGFIKFCFC